MKTTLLKSLHERALFLIDAYEIAEIRIMGNENSIRLEESKDRLTRYLFTSKAEYEIRISELKSVQFRIQIWHMELAKRITSNLN